MIIYDLEKQELFKNEIESIEQKHGGKLNDRLVNYFTITKTHVIPDKTKKLPVEIEIDVVEAFNKIN